MSEAAVDNSPGPQTHVVLVRFGEIFLKKGNRRMFQRQLARNLKAAVGEAGRIIQRRGRYEVVDVTDVDLASRRAARVFGVSSVSPAAVVPLELDALVAEAVATARRAVAAHPTPKSFRISARRQNKHFESDSQTINRVVGAAVNEATGLPVRLDKNAADLDIGIEVGNERAYVFASRIPGPGGLPVGCTGQVALLLSGGIDSPVAGWLAQKRGCSLRAIYFHSHPYTGDKAREKVRDLCEILAGYQSGLRLHVVPFADAQVAIRDNAPPKMYVVLYRRFMIRIAERIARRHGIRALCTGESLAQVASQTLENLHTVDSAAGMVVLRPLLTYDKQETIAVARRIGTYDISIQPHDDCCSLFVPQHPELRATVADAMAAEAGLDVDALVQAAVEGAEVMEVTGSLAR